MKHYAGKVHVRHCVQAVQSAGIDVGGVDMLPDGTVRMMDRATMVAVALRDLEQRQLPQDTA